MNNLGTVCNLLPDENSGKVRIFQNSLWLPVLSRVQIQRGKRSISSTLRKTVFLRRLSTGPIIGDPTSLPLFSASLDSHIMQKPQRSEAPEPFPLPALHWRATSSPPLKSYFQPSSPPLKSYFQPSSPPLKSYFQPSSPPLKSYFQPSSPPLKSYFQPSIEELLPALHWRATFSPPALHWRATSSPPALHWRATSSPPALHWRATSSPPALHWRATFSPPLKSYFQPSKHLHMKQGKPEVLYTGGD